MSEPTPGPRRAFTPLRIAIWILSAAVAIVLIATGIVGILTKAR